MSYDTITYETDGAGEVATLTLNRPDARNGMTNRMVIEAHHALSRAALDTKLKVLLLTGAGNSFCPGADLKHYTSSRPADGEGGLAAVDDRMTPEHMRVPVLLHEMPAVTIAAVNGACAGAGLGWAAACDLRVAARSAMFNSAFLRVAVAGDMGGPWMLTKLLGGAKARELYFMPGKFSADDALRIGLVSKVFDDGEFRSQTQLLVDEVASSAPMALRGMKQNFVAAEKMTFGDYVDFETERHFRISSSADTREAFLAFVEKRTPKFGDR